jgi:hypothetical protein
LVVAAMVRLVVHLQQQEQKVLIAYSTQLLLLAVVAVVGVKARELPADQVVVLVIWVVLVQQVTKVDILQ